MAVRASTFRGKTASVYALDGDGARLWARSSTFDAQLRAVRRGEREIDAAGALERHSEEAASRGVYAPESVRLAA